MFNVLLINVIVTVLVYDDEYSVKSFEAAVKYIKFNPSLNVVIGKMYKVFSNGTDDLVTCKLSLF